MEELFQSLLKEVLHLQATDLHFDVVYDCLNVKVRSIQGFKELPYKYPRALLQYLKYISNMELLNSQIPQNGQFTFIYLGKTIYFRLAVITSLGKETAVLRILNQYHLTIDEVYFEKDDLRSIKQWKDLQHGLILFSGPTGSGKTTTLNAILSFLSQKGKKVITIEDPIEIRNDRFVQLQTNEDRGFTYTNGIKEILRHNPDIIMIGEIRDLESAKLAIRAALTGHLVFATIHAGSTKQAIFRLKDLDCKEKEIKEVLHAVINQQMFKQYRRKERIIIYELLSTVNLQYYWEYASLPTNYKDLSCKIEEAIAKQRITKKLEF